MDKKRLIVSIDRLPDEVLKAIQKKYPDGYTDYVIKVPKVNNDYFYAITVDTDDISYLVKVNVKVDSVVDDDYIDPVDDDIDEIDFDDQAIVESLDEIKDSGD